MSARARTRSPGAERSRPARRFSKTKSMSGRAAARMGRSASAPWAERNSIGSWLSGSTTHSSAAEVLSM